MVTSFKRPHACTAALSALTLQQATADPCLCQGLLDTHGQVWISLLWGSLLLSPGSWSAQGLFVPSKSLFPQSCVISVIKSHWPPKSNSLGVLTPFAKSPGWKICCGSQNFLNSVRTYLVYFSSVCGSSAQQLYSGVNGDLLSGGLCHTQHCCIQSPGPYGRPLLTCTSA